MQRARIYTLLLLTTFALDCVAGFSLRCQSDTSSWLDLISLIDRLHGASARRCKTKQWNVVPIHIQTVDT